MFGLFKTKQKPEPKKASNFPWAPQDETACNIALGHLRENVLNFVGREGKIHAETLICTIGSIGGYSAQRAAFEHMKSTGIPLEPPHINFVETTDGSMYFFGDLLNGTIVSDVPQEFGGLSFWGLAAGGAVAAGADAATLGPLEETFKTVSGNIGTEPFPLSVEIYSQPLLPPRELVKAAWPMAQKCFITGAAGGKIGAAPVKYWPLISGYVANAYIQMVKDIIEPRVALNICMEAALYSSKLSLSWEDVADV